jgi:hypothetical protein
MRSSTELYRSIAPEKKSSRHNPQLNNYLIHGFVPNFSSTTANETVRKRQASVDNQLLGLLGSYHRHTIGTFNTCLRGSTHRSLIDTGGGYGFEGADLPHTTSRPSQLIVSTFHLRAPSDRQPLFT